MLKYFILKSAKSSNRIHKKKVTSQRQKNIYKHPQGAHPHALAHTYTQSARMHTNITKDCIHTSISLQKQSTHIHRRARRRIGKMTHVWHPVGVVVGCRPARVVHRTDGSMAHTAPDLPCHVHGTSVSTRRPHAWLVLLRSTVRRLALRHLTTNRMGTI